MDGEQKAKKLFEAYASGDVFSGRYISEEDLFSHFLPLLNKASLPSAQPSDVAADYDLMCWLVSEKDRQEQLYAHHRGELMVEAFHSHNAIMLGKAIAALTTQQAQSVPTVKDYCIALGKPHVRTAFRGKNATDEQVAYEVGKIHIGIELGFIKEVDVESIDGHFEKVRFDAPFTANKDSNNG